MGVGPGGMRYHVHMLLISVRGRIIRKRQIHLSRSKVVRLGIIAMAILKAVRM
jgi:hypothetical protein